MGTHAKTSVRKGQVPAFVEPCSAEIEIGHQREFYPNTTCLALAGLSDHNL